MFLFYCILFCYMDPAVASQMASVFTRGLLSPQLAWEGLIPPRAAQVSRQLSVPSAVCTRYHSPILSNVANPTQIRHTHTHTHTAAPYDLLSHCCYFSTQA